MKGGKSVRGKEGNRKNGKDEKKVKKVRGSMQGISVLRGNH
jgi:hypothetical protein